MKILVLAAIALLAAGAPAWSQEAKGDDLPPKCKALIADTRACIPKDAPSDAVQRINHTLDMIVENIRKVEPVERQELCQATLMSYRGLANLVCAPQSSN